MKLIVSKEEYADIVSGKIDISQYELPIYIDNYFGNIDMQKLKDNNIVLLPPGYLDFDKE